MTKKKIFERFSSVDLLNQLYTKIKNLFHPQLFIQAILDDAHKRSRMVGVLGREGMGKSSAIADYIQDHRNVFYLRIGRTYAINNFFNEMLYQISGVYPSVSESLFIKMKTLSHLLTKDNSKKLIIIDDAGQLSPRALSVFFEARDNTLHTTAFVFIGLDYFQKKLLEAKKREVPGIAEFYRRVENWYTIPGFKKTEVAEYGKDRGLSDDHVLELEQGGSETIAELENHANAILEEAQAAEKEQRTPIKTKVPGKTGSAAVKAVNPSKAIDDEDDGEKYEEDEIEEKKKDKKRASASRARKAKSEKKPEQTASSDVASV